MSYNFYDFTKSITKCDSLSNLASATTGVVTGVISKLSCNLVLEDNYTKILCNFISNFASVGISTLVKYSSEQYCFNNYIENNSKDLNFEQDFFSQNLRGNITDEGNDIDF